MSECSTYRWYCIDGVCWLIQAPPVVLSCMHTISCVQVGRRLGELGRGSFGRCVGGGTKGGVGVGSGAGMVGRWVAGGYGEVVLGKTAAG